MTPTVATNVARNKWASKSMKFHYSKNRERMKPVFLRSRSAALAIVALLCLSAVTFAAEVTLRVGDPAPQLAVGSWVQGEPVKKLERGKAYLIEFWATWCIPCVELVPHFNEIYEQFKDQGLVVIGQAVSKHDQEAVKTFCTKPEGRPTYRIALDDFRTSERGAMSTTWYDAAGQTAIPVVFLIGRDGKIAWIGDPRMLETKKITEVLAAKPN